jgi:hypothetical protein
MADSNASRRDPRFPLRPGTAFVEFADPRRERASILGELRRISAAGLAFETDGRASDYPPGTRLGDAVLRVGPCELRGDLVVCNATPLQATSVLFGALFYPVSPETEDRLTALIAGIEATVESEPSQVTD